MLARAGVTKGALYHHFENKDALGHAVIEERVFEITRAKWLEPLERAVDPIDGLIAIVQGTSMRPADVRGGCPLNNLALEMSPVDEAFRKRLAKVFERWQAGVADALEGGKTRGLVRSDVDTREAATFLIAVYEGYVSLAKSAQDPGVLQSGIRQVVAWLESLRAPRRHARSIASLAPREPGPRGASQGRRRSP